MLRGLGALHLKPFTALREKTTLNQYIPIYVAFKMDDPATGWVTPAGSEEPIATCPCDLSVYAEAYREPKPARKHPVRTNEGIRLKANWYYSNMACANSFARKGTRSSIFSPTPTKRMGSLSVWAMGSRKPPFAVPSSFAAMMPVSERAS